MLSAQDLSDSPVDVEDALEMGRDLWETYAPPEIKQQFEFPSMARVEEFLAALDGDLATGSFPQLAAYAPDARRALMVLRQFEGGDELADWLAPRLDFLTVAASISPAVSPHAPSSVPRRSAPTPVSRPQYSRPYWDQVVVSRAPPARASEFVPRLKRIFADEGVPQQWVWIAEVESSMNPRARSPVGARGLFQFMPATAEQYGLSASWPDERIDPAKSARAAAIYLRHLHGRFRSWPLVLAAYNAGEGRVERALAATGAKTFFGIINQLPPETRLYVPKVMATVARRESIDPEKLPAPRVASVPFANGMRWLFVSDGILYLTFQNIAPGARLEKHGGLSFGAVGGFVVALAFRRNVTERKNGRQA